VARRVAVAERSRHIVVWIDRPPADVYAFASDPANLPAWAAGLGSSVELVDGRWLADSPMGRVVVAFKPPNDLGVLDHDVTLPSGENVTNPMRVLAGDVAGECEVVFTLRLRAGMTEAELERDAEMVASDLARLKRVLEAGPS